MTDAGRPVDPYTGDPHADERSGLEVAVIGMALRVPGATTVEGFWSNLCGGVESITRFTPEELRAAGVPDEVIADPRYVPAAGVIDDHDLFDASFFGYTPREAEVMDPQQRAFLECAWEALEAAGVDPSRSRQRVGVFAGTGMSAYLLKNLGTASGATTSRIHRMLGNDKDHVGTRVSYKLDLHGPGVTVQTACSTSLVASHLACQSLIAGECDVALAGGVSITLPHRAGYLFEEQGIYSPDGHCRAFDADSAGTVGASGVAIVVLKSLEAALADGDEIHAILPGSAINNDGSAKVGYTAPSVEGQAQVIRAALAAAGVRPDSIGYVETHGTGTKLGDPIEVAALRKAFRGATGKRSCAIGSLKTNVGHLDCAAGAAALIKTVLAVKHGKVPPSLHFKAPNPEIPFDESPFFVSAELQDWPAHGGPRTAGVSSFGMGGTNAHVIVQQAPAAAPPGPGRSPEVLLLSARSPSALEAVAGRLADHLEGATAPDAVALLSDAAATLQTRRRHLPHRRAVVAADVAEAVASLRAGDPKKAATALHEGSARPVVFLFPGQGAQYVGMARGLYDGEPVFREALDECCDLLKAETGWDLREILYPPPGEEAAATERLTRTEVTQPALFAVEYATAKWWMSRGIEPAAMIGHSVGEYVAACLAGVFPLREGLALIAERGRLMQSLPEGEMTAVPLPPGEVEGMLPDGVSVATINEPSRCVVSGTKEAIEALEAELARRDVTTQRLHTSHAFHSAMMDPILEPFRKRVAAVDLKAPEIPYVSNRTGTWIEPAQATDPTYWADHLRHAVRFSDGLGEILKEKRAVLLEVGPGRTLTTFAGRHPDRTKEHATVTSLRHPKDAQEDLPFLLRALGKLWTVGVDVDWAKHRGGERRRLADLPAYPWERKRYWVEPGREAAAAAPRGKIADPGRWFWVEGWKRLPGAEPTGGEEDAAAAPWLIVGGADGFGARLVEELGNLREVIAVEPGDARARIAAMKEKGRLPGTIVHLGAAGAASADADASAAKAADPLDAGLHGLLDLCQAIDAAGIEEPLRVIAVTRGAVDVTGAEELHPLAAATLGLAKIVPVEMPNVACRCVDLEDGSAESAARLARELESASDEPLVALRGGRRWAPAYEPVVLPPAPERPPRLREGGVYLITGGTGAVGLEVAAYLAKAARAKLVLVSRSGLPAGGAPDPASETGHRMGQVRAIEAAGGEVMAIAADVTDRAAMAQAFALAKERFGAVHGVIHAAGADKDMTPLRTATREDVAKVFGPKREGLAVLADLLREERPDFCLVLSSLSSVLGAAGYGAYTAAHAFVDAFTARQDRESPFPWIAVDWDNWITWQTEGETDDGRNVYFMSPAEAADALGRALAHHADRRLIVSTGDLRARVEEVLRASGGEEEGEEESLYERPELQTEYAEATSDAERVLAGIWGKQLGIEKVGIHDDYFELGGDSVIAIQVVSEAARAGLRFTPADIFSAPTVAELAAAAQGAVAAGTGGEAGAPGAGSGASGTTAAAASILAEQEPVIGEVPLTPIQRWFFDRDLPGAHRFNLPVLVDAPEAMDADRLRESLRILAEHHDALRMRYRRNAGGTVTQVSAHPGETIPVEPIDLRAVPADGLDHAIRDHADRIQGTLHLEEGPLVRAALFACGDGRPNRMLLVAHHLLVDVVSWRILLEDLDAIGRALAEGKAPALPPKTTSFRQWAEVLRAWADGEAIAPDRDWWRRAMQPGLPPLPRDHAGADDANLEGTAATLELELPEEETAALQKALPKLDGVRLHDALLAALARAFAGWTGQATLAVDLEMHGREAIAEGIDLSRTAGWFTSLFPVFLESRSAAPGDSGASGGLREDVRRTASRLKEIARRGVAYGALRYLSADASIREELAAVPPAEVAFLYLGQSRRAAGGGETSWRPADLGRAADAGQPRSHVIQVVAQVRDGRLWTEWIHSTALHYPATIGKLAEAFLHALRDIAALGQAGSAAGPAPEDFPAARIAKGDLDALMKRLGGGGKG